MGRSRDLEVSAAAPSRDSAAETARLVQRMRGGSGNTSVTVNHVGGWKNRASKLRMRGEIRDQLDSQTTY